MIPGLNHNVRYRDLVFHVQTEDSGAPRCQLTTHVFHEGSVLAHTRSPYSAEIMSLAGDARGPVVKKQMQEQHKGLLKQLVSGALDAVLIKHRIIPGEPEDAPEGARPSVDSIPLASRAPTDPSAPASRPAPPRAVTPATPAVLDASVATPLDEASSIDLEVEIDLTSLAAEPLYASPLPSLPSARALTTASLDARPTDPTRAGPPGARELDVGRSSEPADPSPPARAVAMPESDAIVASAAAIAAPVDADHPRLDAQAGATGDPAPAAAPRREPADAPTPAAVAPAAPAGARVVVPVADPLATAPRPAIGAAARAPGTDRGPAPRAAVAPTGDKPAATAPPATPAPAPAARANAPAAPRAPANATPAAAAPTAHAPNAATTPATPAGEAGARPRAAGAGPSPGASGPTSRAAAATPPAGAAVPPPRAPAAASPSAAAVPPRTPQATPPAAAPRTLHASLAQAAGREPPPPSSAPQSWNEATPPHMRTSLPGVDDVDLLGRLAPVPLAEVTSAPPASRSPAPTSRSPAPTSRSPKPLDEAAALRELVPAPLRVDGAVASARRDPSPPEARSRREAEATDALGVPPADTSGAWLRARPPIHVDPAMPVVSIPSGASGATLPEAPAVPVASRAAPASPPGPRAGEPRRAPNVRPQTRPPSSIRVPLAEPPRAVTEEQATHAYGRTLAERPATAREIDASVRRTSAPPPMMGIPDARTERILHPRQPAPRPPSALDHEADTHLDLRAIPPEFLASVLADRGTGDLIADLSLANPSWAPGRSLTRPPPPPVPDELLEAADPTIDEILLGLSPTDDELIGDPRSPGSMSSPLADAAWLDPELSLAATPRPQVPSATRAPGIAPPSAWATERSTQTTGRTLPPGPATGRGPAKPSEQADATLLDLPREELAALRAGVLPPLPPPPAEPRPRGDTTSRNTAAPVRGRPVTPPTGPISPAPASARPGPAVTGRPQAAAPSRALSSPRRGQSNAAGPATSRTGDLPSRNSTSAREESAIRRVDDPSLDDIIQGYLDTKKRR